MYAQLNQCYTTSTKIHSYTEQTSTFLEKLTWIVRVFKCVIFVASTTLTLNKHYKRNAVSPATTQNVSKRPRVNRIAARVAKTHAETSSLRGECNMTRNNDDLPALFLNSYTKRIHLSTQYTYILVSNTAFIRWQGHVQTGPNGNQYPTTRQASYPV